MAVLRTIVRRRAGLVASPVKKPGEEAQRKHRQPQNAPWPCLTLFRVLYQLAWQFSLDTVDQTPSWLFMHTKVAIAQRVGSTCLPIAASRCISITHVARKRERHSVAVWFDGNLRYMCGRNALECIRLYCEKSNWLQALTECQDVSFPRSERRDLRPQDAIWLAAAHGNV